MRLRWLIVKSDKTGSGAVKLFADCVRSPKPKKSNRCEKRRRRPRIRLKNRTRSTWFYERIHSQIYQTRKNSQTQGRPDASPWLAARGAPANVASRSKADKLACFEAVLLRRELLICVGLFVANKPRMDVVALLVIVVLPLCGIPSLRIKRWPGRPPRRAPKSRGSSRLAL